MRILLIRLRLIGDVVFTTPIIRALRRRHPGAHLAYVAEPAAAPIVADNPHLDEVIVARAPGAAGRALADLSLARQLRRGRFDLAIDLHGGPRAATLALLSGARRRIGYAIPGRSWLYTDRVPRPRQLRARHSVENQWDLLGPLGVAPPDRERDATEMPVSPAAAATAAAKLDAAGLADRGGLVVIHVSAGNPFRRWPAEAFAALAEGLVARDPRTRVLLLSGPSEYEAARAIGARARAATGVSAARIVDQVELDLRELRAVLEDAALFVGGDSGPLHVAGTSRVPVVGLYGPTLPARSAPWRPARYVTESVEVALPCRPCDQRRCEPGDFRCLGRVTPAAVLAAAERAMAASGAQRTAKEGTWPLKPA
ncbi:MAG TPA: glycosyltransferase family 9 protein [Vicinamibacterales bacterium]|nr:glycosyltransferase family 9 protein [Vicinamibacterales bacterium]